LVPLKAGTYSDTGYRFRKNVFEREDEWYPFYPKNSSKFYDFTLFNSDIYTVSEDLTNIAELYFRLETEKV